MWRLIEPSHLDLCCLQKPIIIACGSEIVKQTVKVLFSLWNTLANLGLCCSYTFYLITKLTLDHIQYLQTTLKAPLTTAANDNSFIFFLFFRENKSWHFMWIVCSADDSHEISRLVFSEKSKKKKKKFRMSSAKILLGALRVISLHTV